MNTARKLKEHYTWKEYRSWPDDQRWELIGGEAFAMSPSPRTRHQAISQELAAELTVFFRGKDCQPFTAPMDVKLSDEDVVQPDLLVVCDPEQIAETHIQGPPTLVIEILSPSSEAHDRGRKLELYARFGVAEYWIVTPNPALIEVLVLNDGYYRIDRVYAKADTLRSPTFPDLEIPLSRVFTLPLAEHEKIDEIRETVVPYST